MVAAWGFRKDFFHSSIFSSRLASVPGSHSDCILLVHRAKTIPSRCAAASSSGKATLGKSPWKLVVFCSVWFSTGFGHRRPLPPFHLLVFRSIETYIWGWETVFFYWLWQVFKALICSRLRSLNRQYDVMFHRCYCVPAWHVFPLRDSRTRLSAIKAAHLLASLESDKKIRLNIRGEGLPFSFINLCRYDKCSWSPFDPVRSSFCPVTLLLLADCVPCG